MAEHRRDVVVVGASAGGVEALRDLVGGFPANLPAAVLVVLHLPAGGSSALAAILDRSGPLPASTARTGTPLPYGSITVAPPDHHLLVVDGQLVLSRGPRENGHRPAVDALFRSAARAQGPRVIGVQLSGSLDDGAAGLVSIACRGGAVVVQDPVDALFPGMPQAALRLLSPDHVVPAIKMGALIARLVGERVETEWVAPMSDLEAREVELSLSGDHGSEHDLKDLGEVSGFACPDCDGVLVHLTGTHRFRCRVGHGWTEEALLEAHGERLERALWTAYRVVEEKASLAKRLSGVAAERGSNEMVARHQDSAREAAQAAVVLRELLLGSLPHERGATEGKPATG